MTPPAFYLASASPRRRDLLIEWGYRFTVRAVDVAEWEDPAADPGLLATRNAQGKARAGAEGLAAGVVLGADTVVWCEGRNYFKPENERDAERILGTLSGREQRVVTAVTLRHQPSGREVTGVVGTAVVMRALSPEQVRAYVASGESLGRAGAYAIRETGDPLVERIDGSLTNVVGLPMEWVSATLAREFSIVPVRGGQPATSGAALAAGPAGEATGSFTGKQ
ncbi:MAG: septum formation protein Maf [Planctomycetes bacterium]|nr:septum formation protein Maf [Planctomycetota bacterium]